MKRRFKENFKIALFSNLAFIVYKIGDMFIPMKNCRYKKTSPAIYAVWHGRQCCLAAVPNRKNLNILISPSNDGEIVARIVEKLGFSTIRGSVGRDGAKAAKQMINAMKNGQNCAYMVDGPKGPFGKVKKGIIKIAKMAQVPIIPVLGHSGSILVLNFNTWDKYQMPLPTSKYINIYGEPIFVSENATETEEEELRQKLETTLFELEAQAKASFNELYKNGTNFNI